MSKVKYLIEGWTAHADENEGSKGASMIQAMAQELSEALAAEASEVERLRADEVFRKWCEQAGLTEWFQDTPTEGEWDISTIQSMAAENETLRARVGELVASERLLTKWEPCWVGDELRAKLEEARTPLAAAPELELLRKRLLGILIGLDHDSPEYIALNEVVADLRAARSSQPKPAGDDDRPVCCNCGAPLVPREGRGCYCRDCYREIKPYKLSAARAGQATAAPTLPEGGKL